MTPLSRAFLSACEFDQYGATCEAYAHTPVGVSMLKTENLDLGRQIIGCCVRTARAENARLRPLLELAAKVVEAAERFAKIEADDGDNFECVHEDVILRVEITAGDLHAVRDALFYLRAALEKRGGE